jgi:ribosomal protein S18 acetylase RimI-like enzyme
MAHMSSDVRVVPSEERFLESFRETLDTVARERRFLILLEAPPLAAIRQFIAENDRRGGVQFFAIDPGDRVVGWCDIYRHGRDGFRHTGTLGIGLLPDYRGRGIGAQLALTAIEAARLNGIERIELEVWASNTKGLALYRQLGFVEEGLRRRARLLDGHYEDSVVMALLEAPSPR